MRRPEIPDDFTSMYIRTALWAETDNSNESGGEPLDYHYGEGDFTNDTLATMVADCQDFQRDNADLLARAYASGVRVGGKNYDEASAGHDFWLTRRGHGAGFWDRGLPKSLGDALSEAARKYGDFYLDVYRGKIHGSPLRKPATKRRSRRSGKSRRR